MTNLLKSDKSPIVSIIFLIVLVALASGVSQFLGILLAQSFGLDLANVISTLDVDNPEPVYQYAIMVMQMIISAISFIVVPALFLVGFLNVRLMEPFEMDEWDSRPFLILFGATISFMIVNSVFIEWNVNLEFPEPLHSTARELEDQAEVLTKYLTDFQSVPYFILGFFVIAILPAIGEEFLFRGLIQNLAHAAFKNIHVAIWSSAILFSAFHFQFFGFVPRMLLGAFFGYVLYFSGSLWYAIAAHFINNGFTLIMLFLYQKGVIQYDIENTDSVPLESVALFLIIGVVLFWYFIKYFQNRVTTQQ